MRDALRLYLRYVGISLRAQLQYRASLVMMMLGNCTITAMEFLFIWTLIDRFGTLRDWRLEQVAIIYGLVHTAFALAEGVLRSFDTFDRMIRNGDFDRILLRPRGAAFQVAASNVQLMRIGRFAQGLFVLIWGCAAAGIDWNTARVVLLLASVLGGACIFGGLFILQSTLTFWTTESLEIVNIVTYGGVETAQFPLSIYRPWFRRFFTFVIPLACANYLPAHAILGKVDVLGTPAVVQWLAPLAGPVFLLVCLRIWNVGVRHYESTGS